MIIKNETKINCKDEKLKLKKKKTLKIWHGNQLKYNMFTLKYYNYEN